MIVASPTPEAGVVAYDKRTGELKWKTASVMAGAVMIKVQKAADGTYDVAELFRNPDFGSHTRHAICAAVARFRSAHCLR